MAKNTELVCSRAGHRPGLPSEPLSSSMLCPYWLSHRFKTESWSLGHNLYIRRREAERKPNSLCNVLKEGCCQFGINQLECYATQEARLTRKQSKSCIENRFKKLLNVQKLQQKWHNFLLPKVNFFITQTRIIDHVQGLCMKCEGIHWCFHSHIKLMTKSFCYPPPYPQGIHPKTPRGCTNHRQYRILYPLCFFFLKHTHL